MNPASCFWKQDDSGWTLLSDPAVQFVLTFIIIKFSMGVCVPPQSACLLGAIIFHLKQPTLVWEMRSSLKFLLSNIFSLLGTFKHHIYMPGNVIWFLVLFLFPTPQGCVRGVEGWFQENLGIILGVCTGVAVIEVSASSCSSWQISELWHVLKGKSKWC